MALVQTRDFPIQEDEATKSLLVPMTYFPLQVTAAAAPNLASSPQALNSTQTLVLGRCPRFQDTKDKDSSTHRLPPFTSSSPLCLAVLPSMRSSQLLSCLLKLLCLHLGLFQAPAETCHQRHQFSTLFNLFSNGSVLSARKRAHYFPALREKTTLLLILLPLL